MSGFWCKKPEDWSLNWILLSNCKIADCDPHEGNPNCSYGETPFRLSRRIIFSNNFLEFLDKQDFDAKINFNSFLIKPSSTWVKLSIEILIDELKPVVVEKIQSE